MTLIRLLVSVRDEAEARVAAGAGADIVDFKDPDRGALAPVAPAVLARAAAGLAGDTRLSAVVGELPHIAPTLDEAFDLAGAAGMTYLKVGVRRARLTRDERRSIARAAVRGARVVVVYYADSVPSAVSLAELAEAGAVGAMLDTHAKDGRTLFDIAAPASLTAFVSGAREAGLMTGLAGSLGLNDIARAARFAPDVIGMRGGLCERADRRATLSGARVVEARERLAALAECGSFDPGTRLAS